MKVEIKGKTLVVSIDLDETGVPSTSGKSKVHASTRGNIPTSVTVGGKTLILSLNAYTKL
jgi:hypothetical protein